jgi:nucleoside-diphosphate-sugar epimerase
MSRDPVRQTDRLQGKLADICDAIGLPPGGGVDGYILPAIERLVAERDQARAAVFHLAADIGDVTSRTSLGLLDLVAAQDELLQAAGRAERVLPPEYFTDPPPRTEHR